MRFHNKVTLVELLEEVAIIGVLVAISIPIFTSQLEKAREAVDAANLRAAYAEVTSDVITGKTDTVVTVDQAQTQAEWQTKINWPKNMDVSGKEPAKGAQTGYWTVKWDSAQDKVVIA